MVHGHFLVFFVRQPFSIVIWALCRSFGKISALNVYLAGFCFLFKAQLCLRFLPPVSFPMSLGLLIHALKFLLGVLRSRRLFFVGDATLSFDKTFTNLSDPSLTLMFLMKSSAGTCVVAFDAAVRCLVKFQRILRRFQINHK